MILIHLKNAYKYCHKKFPAISMCCRDIREFPFINSESGFI